MTTKEQEKKALEQIKKIIAGLGEGSYIATAMDGMIEDAEENIRDDAAYSMKARWDSAKQKADVLSDKYEHLIGVKNHLEKKLAEAEETAKKEFENAHDFAMKLRDKEREVAELQAKLESQKAEFNEAIADKDNLLAKRDFEVMQLKAKLYDLMNQ